MAGPPSSMLRHELIALRHSLAEADDSKVMLIIGALDEMAAGGAVDHRTSGHPTLCEAIFPSLNFHATKLH